MSIATVLRAAGYTVGMVAALILAGFIEGFRRFDCCPHDGLEVYVPDTIGALS